MRTPGCSSCNSNVVGDGADRDSTPLTLAISLFSRIPYGTGTEADWRGPRKGIRIAMPAGVQPTSVLSPIEIGSRVRVRGRRWTVSDVTRSIDGAALRLREIGRGGALTLLTPFDRPQCIDADPRPRAVSARRWLHELDRALLNLHPFGSLHAAARAPIRLLPYQLEPALAVLRDGATRLLVADGVGLGKTIQAGLLLLELAERHESFRAIVLTPAGLREQWRAELSERCTLTPVLADAAWLKLMSTERPGHVNPWSLPGIYIASHDLVKRPEVLRSLEDVLWDAVVIDEAHAARSGTDRRVAIDAIGVRSRCVMLLTATPHSGRPTELEALCKIGGAEPVVMFQRSRADVGAGAPRKTTVLSVVPSEAERRMHALVGRYSRRVWEEAGRRGDDRARLVSVVLRKRALSSAGSLHASVERRLMLLSGRLEEPSQLTLPLDSERDEDPLEDEVPAAVLAVPGLGDAKRERRWLAAIAEAARLAATDERKTSFLQRLLDRSGRRLGEAAIVFTEYRDTLARLEQRLTAAGHSISVLHGALSPAERRRAQLAFNQRGGTLLATDAASEGLNLHERCRLVIHYELPWNPSRLEQRAGRVDRFGQARRVHELALVAADTAERLVLAPLFGRQTSSGRMLHALTESRVAAAIMMDADPAGLVMGVPVATPGCAVSSPPNLELAAIREAARLEHHRALAARSSGDATSNVAVRPTVTALRRRTRIPAGLFFVVALKLVTSDGADLHAEPHLVRIELEPHQLRRFFHGGHGGHGGRPDTDRLHELVDALVQNGSLHSRIDQGGLQLEAVVALEAQRRERQRHREKAIADAVAPGKPSASRLLVQAGLFDRRSLVAASAHARSTRAWKAAIEERAMTLGERAATPTKRAAVIAVLLVPDQQ
jgi:superfamily II DNA or RNA helicase